MPFSFFPRAVLLVATASLGAAELVIKPGDLPRVPPTAPENAAATCVLRPGFRLELMAAEPLVVDPVAMAFDEDGRLYVVEMRDYSERRAEKLGRVKLLEDTDGDGRYDKASIFAENLPWPTSVTCWDGGVFVAASPEIIYFKDTDGDRVADVHAMIFTGFGNLSEKLNVQALLNSLQWGPDQRIHGALGGNAGRVRNFARYNDPLLELRGRDFSFDPRQLDLRPEIGGGQWGITFDNLGRKFFTSNSRHLVQLMYGVNARAGAIPLPPPAVDIPVDGPQAEVFRQSPVEPWRVIRTQWRVAGAVTGPIEGGGRASGYFSGAAGGTIYRGDAFPPEFQGDAFIADCGSNLIHRKKLSGEIQLSAARAPGEEKSEFLASRDNWFRPVAFANAPDGTLWFCDMYRETIEHPWSLPEPLKSNLDLNAGNDRGRLWRIVPDGYNSPALPKLSTLSSIELVPLLEHPNGWYRDTAARLLHERQAVAAIPTLEKFAEESPSPLGRSTALRVLTGCGKLTEETVAAAVADRDPAVRVQAVRSAAIAFAAKPLAGVAAPALLKLADDPSALVRYEFAWTLNLLDDAARNDVLKRLATHAGDDPWMRAAILASAGNAAAELFSATIVRNPSLARELAVVIGARNQEPELEAVLALALVANSPAEWLAPLSEGLSRAGSSLSSGARAERLRPIIAAAADRVRTATGDRTADFALLGIARTDDATAQIASALSKGLDPRNAIAAIAALRTSSPPNLAAILTEAWPKIPAEARPAALQLWRSQSKQIGTLLDAIASGVVAKTDLSAEDIAALRGLKDAALKARAIELLGEAASREQVLATFRPSLEMEGDAKKGKLTFTARCAVCHRFRGEGVAVGPELDASASAGREKLLGNIVEPSREITAGFQMATVETKAGVTISGILVAETDGAIALKMAGGEMRNVAMVDVAKVDRSARSLMPDGIEAGMTPQDMADLLAFLTSR
jgi:putative membrane-bound dehydrogenase-like protein